MMKHNGTGDINQEKIFKMTSRIAPYLFKKASNWVVVKLQKFFETIL